MAAARVDDLEQRPVVEARFEAGGDGLAGCIHADAGNRIVDELAHLGRAMLRTEVEEFPGEER